MSDGHIWCGECSAVVPFRFLDGNVAECVDCASRFPVPIAVDNFERQVAEGIVKQVAELEVAPPPEYTEENLQSKGMPKEAADALVAASEGIKEEEYQPSQNTLALVMMEVNELHEGQTYLKMRLGELDDYVRTLSLELLKLRPLRGGPAEPSAPLRSKRGKPIICGRSPWSGRSESGEAVRGQSRKRTRIPLPGGPYYEKESVDHEYNIVSSHEQLHEACGECGCPMPGTLGARDKECESQRGSPDGALGDDHPYSS